MTVQQAVLERGFLKVDWWLNNPSRTDVENGLAGQPSFTFLAPSFESSVPGNASGDNYANRISGFVIPATSGAYDFFVNSDDDSDLFLSTDDTPANKQMIAQETSWSDPLHWVSSGGGSDLTKKRSDQWSDASGNVPYASGISLSANTMYYIEAVHHEGGGGDNVEATWKKHSDPDPADPSDSTLTGNVIATYAPRCSYVAFTQEPVDATASPLGVAVFNAAGETDSITPVGGTDIPITNNFLMFQWQKNGVDIPGATTGTLTYGPVLPADDGAQFTVKMRALGFADDSLNPIWSNSTAVATLTVRQAMFEPGYVRVDYWDGGTRAPIENNTAGAPTYTTYVAQWDMGSGIADNYARKFSGYFIPPADDDYVFYINSDDDSDLFLSTDSNPANESIIAQETAYSGGLLHWLDSNGTQDQRVSTTFTPDGGLTYPGQVGYHLLGGNKYYMAAVHHEGGGGDYCQVLVTNYADSFNVTTNSPVNMLGSVIGVDVPRCNVWFDQQPADTSAMNLGSATFTAVGDSDSIASVSPNGPPTLDNYPIFYQWYKNGTAIAGATQGTLTLPEVAQSDNNAQFMCKIRALGYGDAAGNQAWSNSMSAKLTVVPTPPTAYASMFTDNNATPPVLYINIAFNKRMDVNTLNTQGNYQLSGGVTLAGLSVEPSGKGVKLAVTGTPTGPVTVTINGVKDAEGIALAANTAVEANDVPLTSLDIGHPADPDTGTQADPAYPSMLWVDGPDAYTVMAQGSDIWGTADGFNFLYEQKTGDFDVVVRQKSITHTSNWAKGGLMVRESLDADSRNWNIVNDPLSSDGIMAPDNTGYGANVIECNRRDLTGGSSTGWDSNRGASPAYPNAWVRLKRTGEVLTAYYSTDGENWTLAATQDPRTVGAQTPLPQTVYVGICTTAHNNDPAGMTSGFQYYNTAEYADYNSNYVPAAGAPTLSATLSGGNIVISWAPDGGTLQSTTALGGTWTDVGTANPATVPMSDPVMFFRVVGP
jgi:hypothetical protein